MSDLFFTADEHHGHGNIIKFCKRPFAHIDESIDNIIANHNAKVPKGARTYHLGDMFWRTLPLKKALDIINALNGQHYFVWGNHDELMEEQPLLRENFVWCKDIGYLEYMKQKIVLCHYAMYTFRGSHRGAWQLYGHTHAALNDYGVLSLDVGVDAWDYAPVSYEEIALNMARKIQMGHGDPMLEKMKKQVWISG
jgi:calcineurin-like phosphoesterase family protein